MSLGLGDSGTCCNELLESPENLPKPDDFDTWHRVMRARIRGAAGRNDVTDGVAAKLLSVYLKLTFVCGGYQEHPRVVVIHPPIDRLLLVGLARHEETRDVEAWTNFHPWSNLNSERYEKLIGCIRRVLNGRPLWEIEKYWPGYQ